MKGPRVSASIPLLAVVVTSLTDGYMFDISFTEEEFLAVDALAACTALGYDGLGIINTPEAYGQALRMSEYLRLIEKQAFFIGLTTDSDTTITMWDDGSLLVPDLPWEDNAPSTDIDVPYRGLVKKTGQVNTGKGAKEKIVLCGNHGKPRSSEAFGSTVHGQMPTALSLEWTASIATGSYLECVMLCGMETLCRVAEFNSDLSLCNLMGPSDDPAGTLIASPASTTFLRIGFLDYL